MRQSAIIGIAAVWVACTLVSIASFWRPASTYVDMDEVYWIGSVYYYDLAFVQHDWTHPDWQLLPARENPPVAKYIIGLGLSVTGQRVATIDTLGYFYGHWARETPALNTPERIRVAAATTPGVLEKLRERGRIPLTRPVVFTARGVMLVCTVLASLLLFLLGIRTANWLAGFIASQLLLLHPLMVLSYNHAMADAIAVMFSTAAALALFHWFGCHAQGQAPSRPRALGWSLATGGLLALACGAKMNSLVLVVLAALLVATLMGQAWQRHERVRAAATAGHGLAILAAALVVFTVINPTILQDPLGGFAATVLEHRHTERLQADFIGGHLATLTEKMGAVARLTAFGWIPFGLLGAAILWCALRQWHEPGIRFAVGWWLVTLICVTAWIPYEWPRYALPLVPPSLLLIGCAVTLALPGPVRARLNCPG